MSLADMQEDEGQKAVAEIEKAGGKITLTRPAKEDAAETASAE